MQRSTRWLRLGLAVVVLVLAGASSSCRTNAYVSMDLPGPFYGSVGTGGVHVGMGFPF